MSKNGILVTGGSGLVGSYAVRMLLQRGERPMPYPEERIPHDQSRAREQLGYEPDYLLEKALADYAETLRKIE